MQPWVITARSFARRMGIIELIHRFRPANSYEVRVHEALTGALKPGDIVWDVGANVGVYTELFCKAVGPQGHVVAFEPLAESCDSIRARLPDCDWLTVQNVALGETDRAGRLITGESSVENHLVTDLATSKNVENSVPVNICRGDTISSRLGMVPNVLKVDVEGFEEEVLEGMGSTLASSALHSILVEVHFRKLEMRGQREAPIRIEKLLENSGFRTRWVDASHVFGTRTVAGGSSKGN